MTFLSQPPVERVAKLKHTKIWRRLARMQETQRVKVITNSGIPIVQDSLEGFVMKVKLRQKQASKEKSSKKDR